MLLNSLVRDWKLILQEYLYCNKSVRFCETAMKLSASECCNLMILSSVWEQPCSAELTLLASSFPLAAFCTI